MPTYYDRVSKAIAIYETAVKKAMAKLKKGFFFDIGNISAIIILIAVASIWSNAVGLVTTLGLSGLNIAAKVGDWIDTIKAYFSARHKLDLTVLKLREELELCDPNDERCLTKVVNLMRDYMDALERT